MLPLKDTYVNRRASCIFLCRDVAGISISETWLQVFGHSSRGPHFPMSDNIAGQGF